MTWKIKRNSVQSQTSFTQRNSKNKFYLSHAAVITQEMGSSKQVTCVSKSFFTIRCMYGKAHRLPQVIEKNQQHLVLLSADVCGHFAVFLKRRGT